MKSEMQPSLITIKITDQIFGILNKIPFVAFYAKTRGWAFILSWSHRITGLLLVLYVWFHLITLSALSIPGDYDAKMALFSSPLIVFFEWLLAIPMIFHAVMSFSCFYAPWKSECFANFLLADRIFHCPDWRICIPGKNLAVGAFAVLEISKSQWSVPAGNGTGAFFIYAS
ncbi:MAG: hypothetical protein JRD84_15355 [Deltaproteobacteria bacterium]|nr:hypothetical protein [Deltaproteobacteria bacterium]